MTTALPAVDMRERDGGPHPSDRDRVNPDSEAHVADLLWLFRARGLPVVPVHQTLLPRRARPAGGQTDTATVLRATLSLPGADFAQLFRARDIPALI